MADTEHRMPALSKNRLNKLTSAELATLRDSYTRAAADIDGALANLGHTPARQRARDIYQDAAAHCITILAVREAAGV